MVTWEREKCMSLVQIKSIEYWIEVVKRTLTSLFLHARLLATTSFLRICTLLCMKCRYIACWNSEQSHCTVSMNYYISYIA